MEEEGVDMTPSGIVFLPRGQGTWALVLVAFIQGDGSLGIAHLGPPPLILL